MPIIVINHRWNWLPLAVAGTLCLALIVAPVTFDGQSLEVSSKTALAKKGGDKGGGKGNGGGDRGRGGERADKDDRGGGRSQGVGHRDKSLGEVVDNFRSGKVFGFERKDHRLDRAKGRYRSSLGAPRHRSTDGADVDADRVAHRFNAKQTRDLIGRGWKTDQPLNGFANHGERVRTMVALAKALGYDAKVGALQANFGTPAENGIAALQDELAAARIEAETDPEAVERVQDLEARLAAAIDQAKPGRGPADDWASVDLDVNDDGVVDRADLAALGGIVNEDEEGDGFSDDDALEESGGDPTSSTIEASLN